jgi:flagellar basal-body rod protein FlgG
VLKIVHFDAGAPLDRLGNGLLGAPASAQVQADGRTQVQQGFLENANVNSAQEMTQLMQAMRHLESMHKVAQAHDDMLGTAIRKLGETG